jgi:hypothetical protein
MFRRVHTPIMLVIIGSLTITPALAQGPTSTAITYQGQLKQDGEPLIGTADFYVGIYDVETGGDPLDTLTLTNVTVNDGLFTLELNFDRTTYNGDGLWLEFQVAAPPGSPYTTLTPRQPVRPAPYALYALGGAGAGDSPWQQSGSSIYYDNGNVGVGTNNPTYRLHVIDPTGGTAVAGENPGESNYGYLGHEAAAVYGYNNAAAVNGRAIYGRATGPDGFGGYFEGRGYFSGNVGIGTTSFGSPLTVAGLIESTASGFKFPDGTIQTTAATGGGDSFWESWIDGIHYSAGNVGIGNYPSASKTLYIEAGSGEYALHAYAGSSAADITVVAENDMPGGRAVFGQATGASGTTRGIYGYSESPDGAGVFGENESSTGAAVGVYGRSSSPDGFGGYFLGRGYFSDRLGIGTMTPGYPLHAVSTGGDDAVAGENPDQFSYGYLGHELAGVYGAYGAASGPGKGVYGYSNSPDGFGGYFDGKSYFGGNVGIGTTTPGSPLTVAGLVESTTDGFKFPDGTVQITAAIGGGDSFWTLNGSDIYYNAGNVGIGTSSPLGPLHVEGASTNSLWARNTATEGPAYAVHAYSASTSGCAVYGEAASTIGTSRGVEGSAASPTGVGVYGYNEAETGEAIAVRGFTASPDGFAGYFEGGGYFSGNVGIGTTSPGSPLTVAGRIESTADGVHGQTASTNGSGVFGQNTSETGQNEGVYGVGSSPDGYGVWGHNASTTTLVGKAVGVYGTTASTGGVGVKGEVPGPRGMAVWGRTNGTNATAVKADALAVSGPATGLDAYSASPDGYAVYASNEGETGNAIAVRGDTNSPTGFGGYFNGQGYFSGNLGIGTTSPQHSLHIVGDSAVGSLLVAPNAPSGDGSAEILLAEDDDYTYGMSLRYQGADNQLHVYGKAGNNSYGPHMSVNLGNGRVGIGTTTPAAELEVVGTACVDGFRLGASPIAGYVLTCDANGNGTWQEPAGAGGLALPYSGSVDDDDLPGFQVGNSGLGGGIKGICSDGPAVVGHSDGLTGIGVEAIGNGWGNDAPALRVENTNASGTAIFSMNNSPAANAVFVNRGSGNIITGYSGPAGDSLVFRVANDGTTHTNALQIDGSDSDWALWVSSSGNAAYLMSNDPNGYGIEAHASGLMGKAIYGSATGNYGVGVKAESIGDEGSALYALASGANASAVDAKNESTSQAAIVARNYAGGPLIQARNAPTNTVFEVANDGTTSVEILHIVGGSDLAERFDVSDGKAQPGMVVEIDPESPGKLRIARGEYNRRVAGVISGANELEVGMVLADLPGSENSQPIALSGRVWVYCDASKHAIAPGDMLTTAERPGHAMAVADFERAHGAVIGKAMTSLDQGQTGMVLALVNLQ